MINPGSGHFSGILHSTCNRATFVGVVFLMILFQSCELINPTEEIPSYVEINSVKFTTNYSVEGSNLTDYPDCWVYVDNNYLGTYEMPVTFPVLEQGSHKISVRAGIYENGIAATRSAYSKLITFDTVVTLEPNVTRRVEPEVRYLNNTNFAQMEDFDDGSISFVTTNTDYAPLQLTQQGDTNAFEGASGVATMDNNKPFFEVASGFGSVLPVTTATYLEMNYKSESEIRVSVLINTATNVISNPLLNIRPSSTWKKIFINIRDLNGTIPEGLSYKIVISSALPATLNTATVYLDNIKLLF